MRIFRDGLRYAGRFFRECYGRSGLQSFLVSRYTIFLRNLTVFLRLVRWSALWTRSFQLATTRTRLAGERKSDGRTAVLPKWDVINLRHRFDRLSEISREMEKMNIEWTRVEAVHSPDGALGCARSHLKTLRREGGLGPADSVVAVAEDDLLFEADLATVVLAVEEFLANRALDVLCLSHRTRGVTIPVSRSLRVANEVSTTSAYIVKRKAVPVLIRAFEKSEEMLRAGIDKRVAAIDVVWHQFQLRELLFAVPREFVARQRPSYSDVAHKYADYRY